ncbi:MAG: hypothetical protein PHE24_03620 [Patescibacteria group bacterium]|nr:hypothetical protein [Patescibacteria group bacterium]
MRKMIFISILTIIFNIQAQSVKEVDLFMIGGLTEMTRLPSQFFTAVKENAQKSYLGQVKSILVGNLSLSIYTVWFMTSERKFYEMYFDMNSKKAEMQLDSLGRPRAMTRDNLDKFSFSDEREIKYFVRDPDHRIPNDIPNSQNVLYDLSP